MYRPASRRATARIAKEKSVHSVVRMRVDLFLTGKPHICDWYFSHTAEGLSVAIFKATSCQRGDVLMTSSSVQFTTAHPLVAAVSFSSLQGHSVPSPMASRLRVGLL
jgi:hypothetical protein